MIIFDGLPLNMTTTPAFKDWSAYLNPKFKAPTPKTLTHTLIPAKVKYVRERIESELKDVTQINMTTDNWTSLNNRNFLAITGHWISKEWNLVERVLVITEYTETHHAEKI